VATLCLADLAQEAGCKGELVGGSRVGPGCLCGRQLEAAGAMHTQHMIGTWLTNASSTSVMTDWMSWDDRGFKGGSTRTRVRIGSMWLMFCIMYDAAVLGGPQEDACVLCRSDHNERLAVWSLGAIETLRSPGSSRSSSPSTTDPSP
jgi:hypothetical protein